MPQLSLNLRKLADDLDMVADVELADLAMQANTDGLDAAVEAMAAASNALRHARTMVLEACDELQPLDLDGESEDLD